MMKIKASLIAVMLTAIMAVTLSGCKPNGEGESSSSSTSSGSGTTIAKPIDDTPEQISAIKNAKIGDTITFNNYCVFVQEDGTKVYFADGAYAFVFNSVVVETRKAVNISDSNATIDEIIAQDSDFTGKKDIKYYFYNSKNEPVTYTSSARLTAEICYALVEVVDWTDEAKKQGKYYSYAFSYGDAPVKITSVYVANDENTSDTSSGTTSGDADTSNTSSATSDTSSNTSNTSSVTTSE